MSPNGVAKPQCVDTVSAVLVQLDHKHTNNTGTNVGHISD